MTQSYGPKSINDNLLVYLDARNIKSYAGEPTTNVIKAGATWWGDGSNQTGLGSKGAVVITDENLKYNGYDTVLWTPGTGGNCYLNGTDDIDYSSTSTEWTWSCYIKSQDGGFLSNASNNTLGTYLYKNGESFPSESGTSVGVHVGDGWYRFVYSKSIASGYISLSGFYSFRSNQKFYLSGWQLEKKQYATPVVGGGSSRSPVDGWKDLSGNGHHADLSNMTGSVVSHYKDKNVISPRNNAFLNFNGSDTGVADYALVGALNQTYSNFSVEFWIKLNGTAQLDDNDRFWSWNTGGTMTIRYRSTPTIQFHYNPADGSPASTSINGPTLSPAVDVWLHVVVTNDRTDTSTGAKVYINGVSGTGGEPSVPLLDTSYILGTGLSATVPTACDIAIYKLYSKSLTSEEVLNNYNIMKGRFE
jgi:hypothetical protein